VSIGKLALQWCHVYLDNAVYKSGAGYYIGTFNEDGPCSRESVEYYSTKEQAQAALEANSFTQRSHP